MLTEMPYSGGVYQTDHSRKLPGPTHSFTYLPKMQSRLTSLLFVLAGLLVALAKQPVGKYQPLPSLKEQDALEQKWVQARYDRIPGILKEQ